MPTLTQKMGKALYAFVVVCLLAHSFFVPPIVNAASTNQLLRNTEAFEQIDGDGLSDPQLRFGSAQSQLFYRAGSNRFEFTKSVWVQGSLTATGAITTTQTLSGNTMRVSGNADVNGVLSASGAVHFDANLSINDDRTAATDATLTFGNATLNQAIHFVHATQKFRFTTSVDVAGTISGTALTVSGLLNCNTIDTDSSGVLSCGTDEGGGGAGISQVDGDARYLRKAGGTMTGAITNLKLSNLTTSGGVLYASGSSVQQSAKGLSGQILVSKGTASPQWATPAGGMIWYFNGTQAVGASKGPQITMPIGVQLSNVTMSAKGAPVGAAYIVDINRNGSSIFATRPQINAGAVSGGTGAVLSVTSIAPGSTLTLDIDQIGSTFAGSGMTIMLSGVRKY